jgi:Ca2+-binding RTX toxin-like protein
MAKLDKVLAHEATEGEDYILGTDLADEIDGLGGDDKIKARGGDDTVRGGEGNDTITAGEGDDLVLGDRGDDKIYGDEGDDTNVWNNGDGTDKFYGGEGYDTQIVNGSPDLGDEFTIAAYGEKVQFDRVNFGQFGVTMKDVETLEVNGLGGDDTITGSEGLSELIKLKLSGGDGNDEITGGDGDDWIDGGYDDDVMTGNEGADTFVFKKGHDVITDFEDGYDQIVLEKYDAYWEFEAKVEQDGKDVVIEYGHNSLTIAHASAWDIDENDFVFV